MKPLFSHFSKIFILPVFKLFIKKIEGYDESVFGKEGLSSQNGLIVAPNHINSLDHWIISLTLQNRIRDIRFIGALDEPLLWLPSKILYYLANTIPINRKKISREDFIKKVLPHLEKKKIIIIYPEGTINREKELLRGKTGVAELAIRSGAPIIPFGMEKKRGFFKRTIRLGKPLFFTEERKNLQELEKNPEKFKLVLRSVTDRIMREISKLCNKPYLF